MAKTLEGPGHRNPVPDPIQDCPHCRRSYKLSVVRKLLESEADEMRNVHCLSKGCGGVFNIGPAPLYRLTVVRSDSQRMTRPSGKISRTMPAIGFEETVQESSPSAKDASAVDDNAQTKVTAGAVPVSRLTIMDRVKARIKDEVFRQVVYESRYKAIEILGEGTSGIVVKAEDLEANKVVAVKFHVDTAVDDDDGAIARARAMRAARVQRMFDNPHVAKPLATFEHPEYGVASVEDFISGNALNQEIDRRNQARDVIPEREARLIARQMAEVLAEAYKLRVIHRDIKPHNVILSERAGLPLIHVVDWGLARVEKTSTVAGRNVSTGERNKWDFIARLGLSAKKSPVDEKEIADLSASLTNDKDVLGTPYYLSPEIIKGGEADHRSDLYSLGASLYHLVTGGPPFVGTSLMEIVYNALHRDLDYPWVVALQNGAALSKEFSALITKLLARDPDARYQNAKLFIDDLDALPEVKLRPKPSETSGSARIGKKPNRFWRLLISFLILALTTAAAVYYLKPLLVYVQ